MEFNWTDALPSRLSLRFIVLVFFCECHIQIFPSHRFTYIKIYIVSIFSLDLWCYRPNERVASARAHEHTAHINGSNRNWMVLSIKYIILHNLWSSLDVWRGKNWIWLPKGVTIWTYHIIMLAYGWVFMKHQHQSHTHAHRHKETQAIAYLNSILW